MTEHILREKEKKIGAMPDALKDLLDQTDLLYRNITGSAGQAKGSLTDLQKMQITYQIHRYEAFEQELAACENDLKENMPDSADDPAAERRRILLALLGQMRSVTDEQIRRLSSLKGSLQLEADALRQQKEFESQALRRKLQLALQNDLHHDQ